MSDFLGGAMVANHLPANAGDTGDAGSIGFNPWVGKIPWRRKWQPTVVFLPGESLGQRSLEGCSPWGCKRVGYDLATKQQSIFYISYFLDIVIYITLPSMELGI